MTFMPPVFPENETQMGTQRGKNKLLGFKSEKIQLRLCNFKK